MNTQTTNINAQPTQLQNFDGATSALCTGLNLIEASAGTGKTFAIALLVLRFVAEKGIAIENILVVSFTKAATEELKTRIRSRLFSAQQALTGGEVGDLSAWLNTLTPQQKEQALGRIEAALLSIDMAGIYTIHGFCQSALKQFSLASGQAFETELVNSLNAQQMQVVEDFWREWLYPMPEEQAEILLARFSTPQKLWASVNQISPQVAYFPTIDNPAQKLKQALAELANLKQAALGALATHISTLRDNLDCYNKPIHGNFETNAAQIQAWLEGKAAMPNDLSIIDFKTCKAHEKKAKNCTGKTEQLNLDFSPFARLLASFQSIPLLFRMALAERLNSQLVDLCATQNILSFNDLIANLSQALKAENGALLRAALQQQFQVALIDEFQDTDSDQWFIFSNIFTQNHPQSYCYLIGDPKQAIYKFRGADIHAYFKAQHQAQNRFTLGKNWRSHPQVVQGVNTLFLGHNAQVSTPFKLKELNFYAVSPAKTADEGGLWQGNVPLSGLTFWHFPHEEDPSKHWTTGKFAKRVQQQVVAEILSLLTTRHSDPSQAFVIKEQAQSYDVRAQDIAILVDTHTSAAAYQTQLSQQGVPCVIVGSKMNVFDCALADDLFSLLQAIAHPSDLMKAKAALTLKWFGLNGLEYWQVLQDSTLFETWLNFLQARYLVWQQQGVLSMFNQLMTQPLPQWHSQVAASNLQTRIMQQPQAERNLTDLWHMVELLQNEANEQQLGILKTLALFEQFKQSNASNENAVLRLENDEKAVRIMTMHASKGLEFPIVFCPDLVKRSAHLNTECDQVFFHNHDVRCLDLGSEHFAKHKDMAIQEEWAEQIRLLYVALTRAKYRCYVPWGKVGTAADRAVESGLYYVLCQFPHLLNNTQATPFKALDALDPLMALQARNNHIQVQEILQTPDSLPNYQVVYSENKLQARAPIKPKFSSWRMTSYSGLAKSVAAHAPLAEPDTTEQRAQELIDTDLNDAPETLLDPAVLTFQTLPKGAKFGSMMHDILEELPFADIASLTEGYQRVRQQKNLHYGQVLTSEDEIKLFDNMMQTVCQAPWQAGISLAQLKPNKVVKEMPFYLSLPQLNCQRLNELMTNQADCQPIAPQNLSGFLTGFIDLVCEHQGRYYVIDYKSNHLPNYHPTELTQAMQHHNYGLQYRLYSLVLHRYLSQRLPNYDYANHFGGIAYLFVRGMAQANHGVYFNQMPLSEIESWDAVFAGVAHEH